MYESHFGLHSKPFQLTPDPAFYFGSKVHNRALAYLKYGVNQGEGFIVVTGDVGAGKTTLIRSLRRHLDAEQLVVAQLVSTQVGGDDMLRMIATAFGLTTDRISKATILQRLEAFLAEQQAQGKRALLLVDEAQNLGASALEELRMVSNFQIGEKSLLQSFLVGQPEFRDTMQAEHMEQLRQRVIASCHLGPLDAGETRAYIEHRLVTAGWHDDPAFSADAFTAIYQATGGIPRQINMLCNRLMLYAFLEDVHQIESASVEEVAAEQSKEFGLEQHDAAPAANAAAGAAAGAGGSRNTRGAGDARSGDSTPARLVRRVSELESALIALQNRVDLLAAGASAATPPAPAGTVADEAVAPAVSKPGSSRLA
ncbi:MAG: XrtA-associated ATPase [Pseudomonadota bacterium]|nr:XrtA-associated ATPase [Pseudomonadota bacterium]